MNKRLQEICELRPFRTRNADEYSLAEIFTLFVDPQKSLINPFDFENNIIKGRMGSGKTMFLRANYAYYQYTLVPSLLDGIDPIIPIYIKLSDYQNITDHKKLYERILLRIIKEMVDSFSHLKNSQKLASLHNSFIELPKKFLNADSRLSGVIDIYKALTATEFTEKVSTAMSGQVGLKWNVFTALAGIEKKYESIYKNDTTPSVEHISYIYDQLLKVQNGKILILFDEAGSIHKNFFKGTADTPSYFEILMNQLRTMEYLRVKIAIYPQTVSDVLTETRYGDVVFLQENIHDLKGYRSFYSRTVNLLNKYIQNALKSEFDISEIFKESEDPIEHLINASNGNMRRLIQLIDMSLL